MSMKAMQVHEQARNKRPSAASFSSSFPKRHRSIQQAGFSESPGTPCPSTALMLLPNNYFYSFRIVSRPTYSLVDNTLVPPATIFTVAEIMNTQLQQCHVQHCGIRVLNESGPAILGATVYVQRLINAMQAHTKSPLIHYEACRGLLYWLKSDEQVMLEIGQANILSTLMDSLDHQSSSVHLRYMKMEIVRSLVVRSTTWLQTIGSQIQVVSSLLRQLKRFSSDVVTQQIGLSILSWVVEVRPSRDIVVKEGGVEYLQHAMEIHTMDDVVQCNATATFCWLIHTSECPAPLVSVGPSCVAVVLATMKRFMSKSKVFGNSLCILSGVLASSSRQPGPSFPSLEVVDLALSGMTIHCDSPKVIRNGLTLMRFLLMNAEDMDQVGTIVIENLDVIENCMKEHSDDSAIQADACGILAQLGFASEETRAVIKRSGCIDTVVQAQLKHHGDIRLQHHARWFHRCFLRGLPSEAEQAFGAGLPVLETIMALIALP